MAKADSKRPAAPAKPYPQFPLTYHPRGYWCKKIRGSLHYFGPRYGTWEAALEEYERDRDALHAGRPRRTDPEATTMKLLCNSFLTDRQHRLDTGDLTQRSFDDYFKTCERLIDELGKSRCVADLIPEDFLAIREKWSKKWGPKTLSNEIIRTRVVFRYGYQAGLIEREVRFGPSFKSPSRRVLRLHRHAKGPRMLTPSQIHDLLAAADPQMQAMILLACNAGLGNKDCGMLNANQLDLRKGWLNYPRPKTGVSRRAKLWPETCRAIRESLKHRYTPSSPDVEGAVFVTRRGNRWCATKGKADPISRAFRELLDKLEIRQPGRSFYTLRHVFETIAGDSGDQVATNFVMGHVDNSMASDYREDVFDHRLEAIANHVHAWLYGGRES